MFETSGEYISNKKFKNYFQSFLRYIDACTENK